MTRQRKHVEVMKRFARAPHPWCLSDESGVFRASSRFGVHSKGITKVRAAASLAQLSQLEF